MKGIFGKSDFGYLDVVNEKASNAMS